MRIYIAATKELTAERLAGNVTKWYETSQYGEPFFVLQKPLDTVDFV